MVSRENVKQGALCFLPNDIFADLSTHQIRVVKDNIAVVRAHHVGSQLLPLRLGRDALGDAESVCRRAANFDVIFFDHFAKNTDF